MINIDIFILGSQYSLQSVISEVSLFFFFVFSLFRAAGAAYGGSQSRGLIGAVAAGLHQSHNNARSERHL